MSEEIVLHQAEQRIFPDKKQFLGTTSKSNTQSLYSIWIGTRFSRESLMGIIQETGRARSRIKRKN